MAMASWEPQFEQLNQSIEGTEFMEQETETAYSISPIEDHVQIQKDNAEKSNEEEAKILGAEGDYESDEELNTDLVFDIDSKRIRCFAVESLKLYNRQMGTKYKLKRVLEATGNLVSGTTYCIKFIAEEGCSDDEPDNPALMLLLLEEEGDEKVVYDSGDDKVSDQLFVADLYWKLHADSVNIKSCEIISEQAIQKDNAEKSNEEEAKAIEEEYYESDEECKTYLECDTNSKDVHCFAAESLKFYNRQMGTKYKLKRVLKATEHWVSGFTYAIKFTAEEGCSDDGPPLKFLRMDKEGDEKVVYDCGDDKVSDKLFVADVYWKLDYSIKINSCEIITEQALKKPDSTSLEEANSIPKINKMDKTFGNCGLVEGVRTSRTNSNALIKLRGIEIFALVIFLLVAVVVSLPGIYMVAY